MKLQRNLATYLIIVVGVLAGLVITAANLFSNTAPTGTGDLSSAWPASFPEPPPSCKQCTHELLTASPEDIAKLTVEELQLSAQVRGYPEVLLVRTITREELRVYGLSCAHGPFTIEEPPWVLVVLRGNLDFNRRSGLGPDEQTYGAVVVDIWAGHITSWFYSRDSGRFQRVLSDATLSPKETSGPLACPTDLPYPRTQHYGEQAPPIAAPPTQQFITQSTLTPPPIPSPYTTMVGTIAP